MYSLMSDEWHRSTLNVNCTYRLVNRTLLTRNGRLISDESLVTSLANAAQSCKRRETSTKLEETEDAVYY